MRIIRLFACYAVMLLHACVFALDITSCEDFGTRAHTYPRNLYVASLNVGTGECHVVRRGDSVVIFDAGHRYADTSEDYIVECLCKMISHQKGSRRERATLEGLFITHGHNDHLNLVKPILDSSIKRGDNFRVYLGGAGCGTYDSLVKGWDNAKYCFIEDKYAVYENINGFYISGGNVSTLARLGENSANDYGGMFFLDCFRKRRIAFLGDMSRFSLEMIGSPLLYNGYPLEHKTNLTTNRHPPADRQELYEELCLADIFTSPHHASLSKEENFVYGALASSGEKGKRICISSASPIKKYTMPTITPLLLDSFKGYTPVFEHALTCDCGLDDSVTPSIPKIAKANITVPIFSTYDAVGGFVWTLIKPTGAVKIYDGITAKFEQVL